MFWRKSGILIPYLYLYSIKIQTNIKQNSVEEYAGKLHIFWNNFWRNEKKIIFFNVLYIYIYIEREREREREWAGPGQKRNWAEISPTKCKLSIPVHSNLPKYNYPVTVLMHSIRVIICSFTCRTCTVHVLHARRWTGKRNRGERVAWNGGVFVHGSGGSRWCWCRGNRLWWQTLVLLLLSSASVCYLLPLFFFVLLVNSVLVSLQRLRGGVGGGGLGSWFWLVDGSSSSSLRVSLLLLSVFFCFVFLAVAMLLVAHSADGVSRDGEKETREMLQCLSSSLSIFCFSAFPSLLCFLSFALYLLSFSFLFPLKSVFYFP